MDFTGTTGIITAAVAAATAITIAIVAGCRAVSNAFAAPEPRSKAERREATDAGGSLTAREMGDIPTQIERLIKLNAATDATVREHMLRSMEIHGEMWQVILRRVPVRDDGRPMLGDGEG